ncbi:Predicted transcriptional regulator containing CBS domains [Pelagirhabdus alkalitolerans]|uniref:Predicted transcriptional regulator containing CBS domains n=1 Tax=Pelagirhabdus alkalitolerans TaxID=1612202 RepID=A0A1G6HJK1_9BACI|nr:DRTGG domain-containing protein [Pelagirhabdus alkalitolerans]SDB94430.1 Predicted transcriptional regulator containing CBS domains [Pelagirhabdus alkalitolerans]
MATKHEQILKHIESLKVGNKISVRQTAKDLNVSEGTAYRAIKEAENQGLVSTIERVGTIRIEQKRKENFEHLTFAEIIGIVDGQVLGGREGLYKTLHKFVIGAMKTDAMMRYLEKDSLLIIGNRSEAHRLALEEGAAVLITGGFDTDDQIKRLADEKQLPIISTSYDTFTVAAMINRAIYDQLIKKEIVLVGDIYTDFAQTHYLNRSEPISRWYELNHQTTHSRYPVVDDQMRVVGIVTSKDIIGKPERTQVEKVMTKNPMTVFKQTSLAYAAHMMVWEGIEIVPVVNQNHKLEGLISRQDVLKALQHVQRQPQVGETIDDIVTSGLLMEDEGSTFKFHSKVTPQMTNALGTLSNGVFVSFISEVSSRIMTYMKKGDLVVENISVYFIKPVQLESEITIIPKILEIGRKSVKIDIEIHHEKDIVGKAVLIGQLIDR